MTLCSFASFSNGEPIKSNRRANNSAHYILRSTLRDRTCCDRILATFRRQRSRERVHHREQMILVVAVCRTKRARNEEVEPNPATTWRFSIACEAQRIGSAPSSIISPPCKADRTLLRAYRIERRPPSGANPGDICSD